MAVTPRKAAAVVILRDDETLLVRRNVKLAFMGGHHAFPGGALDRNDDARHVVGAENSEQALAMFAAAREVFEETGLMLARGPQPDPEPLQTARRAIHAHRETFAQILDRFGLRIHAEDFAPAGVWITPGFSPARFHTQYFLCNYSGDFSGEVLEADGEIVGLDWLRAGEARWRWHMGLLKLSTPVAVILRHLEQLRPPELLDWLRRVPFRNPNMPDLFETRPGILILPVHSHTLPPAAYTNCVVIGEEQLYVVDPGATDPDEQEHLRTLLEHLAVLGGRVAAILLTHAHKDHAGAAPFLRTAFGAPIWCHEAAAREAGFAVDRFLSDGEVIEVAGNPPWRIRCLHTPGHNAGHLCFLEESTGSLLCGDMMANPGTILISPDYGGDMTQYLASLERLLQEDVRFTVPGHGLPSFGESGRGELRRLIAHRQAREARIRAAWDSGARTVDDLMEKAYDDVGRETWPLAEQQLRAHLARLGLRIEGPPA